MNKIVYSLAAIATGFILYRGLQKKKTSKKTLRIGTRKSKLAVWQAEFVKSELQKLHPNLRVEIIGRESTGDINLTAPLSAFTDKGVFTKQLDEALLNNEIDIAVHCMKDLMTTLPKGIVIGAALDRGNTEDCVIFHEKHRATGKTLGTLPAGSVIGTSALRRCAVLRKHFPHLQFQNIRGNVQTRLAKLDRGDYDAIILARVGLERLDSHERIHQILDDKVYGYAVGQGALAVCCRDGDKRILDLLQPIQHVPTMLACTAERGMLRNLEGGCKVPIAVYSLIDQNERKNECKLQLKAWIVSQDGRKSVQDTIEAILSTASSDIPNSTKIAQNKGEELADILRQEGGEEILKEIRKSK